MSNKLAQKMHTTLLGFWSKTLHVLVLFCAICTHGNSTAMRILFHATWAKRPTLELHLLFGNFTQFALIKKRGGFRFAIKRIANTMYGHRSRCGTNWEKANYEIAILIETSVFSIFNQNRTGTESVYDRKSNGISDFLPLLSYKNTINLQISE